MPTSCTYIGDAAFGGCSRLGYIGIPASVTTIKGFYSSDGYTNPSYAAFYGCTNLYIATTVTSVPSGWEEGWNYSDEYTQISVGWGDYLP